MDECQNKVRRFCKLLSIRVRGMVAHLKNRISLDWEDQFVEVALNSSSMTATVIPNASKSFADISAKAIFFDAYLMGGGYLLMFAYTILMLGKLNRLEVESHKILPWTPRFVSTSHWRV